MTDANKEPQAAPGEILQEPTPEREPQQQTPARQLIEGYKDILNQELLEPQGKRLEDMTAGELMDSLKDMTPEEQAQLQAQFAEMLASFAEANREALDGITRATRGILSFMAGETNPIADALARAAQKIGQALKAAREAREEFIKSEEWPKLQAIFPDINEYQGAFIAFMAGDLIEYGPEITEILEEYETQEGRPLTFEELLERPAPDDPNPDDPGGSVLLEAILYRAQQIREERNKPAPAVKYLPATNRQIQLNIDKLMRTLFNPRTEAKAARAGVQLYIRDQEAAGYKPKKGEIPGQLSFFPVSYEKGGAEELTLYYSIDYDDDMLKKLGLPGETTAEDFFILSVIADAAIAGNTDISPTKLYKEFTGREPNKTQRTQFVNRLMKMAGTMVDLDDREVMKAWGQETYNQYYGQLAPLKFINKRHVINGGIADGIIKITDFPDILRTGRQIGQYITVPKSLLYVKKKNGRALKRTPRFYEILMILLKEIARIKKGQRVNKILYSWLYNELDIEEKDYHAREDALETMFEILDHFKREAWITGYKETTTKSTGAVGVSFTWSDTDGKGEPVGKRPPKRRRQAKNTTPDNKGNNPRQ